MEGRWTLSDKLLAVKMEHRVGGLSLDVSFALTRPWTVLFGPSGSGKTTVLRAIAGFVRPDDGEDRLWADGAGAGEYGGTGVCACACEAGAECGSGGEVVSASDGAGECRLWGGFGGWAGAGGCPWS